MVIMKELVNTVDIIITKHDILYTYIFLFILKILKNQILVGWDVKSIYYYYYCQLWMLQTIADCRQSQTIAEFSTML